MSAAGGPGDGAAVTVRGPTAVSVVRVLAVPRQRLFDLVADPALHPRIDGSGTLRGVLRGPARLGPGARFGMGMRMGLPYRVTNRVVEFEEGRRIAWTHFSGNVWRWEFPGAPLDGTSGATSGATEVTETFDWGRSRAPWAVRRMAAGNAAAMARSIGHLGALAADGDAG
ncbi:MAG: dimethyladenosine transferase [Nitriliruptoraceae bacterium]